MPRSIDRAMSRIDDIRLKVNRANGYLEDFKATIRGQRGTIDPPHAVRIHFEPKRQEITVGSERVKPGQQLEWGIILGDVVHQLRTVLDHLVYALAARTATLTEKEIRHLNVPIHQDSNDFSANDAIRSGFLERVLGSDELAEIERSQPYKRKTASPTSDELWLLKRLDDIDKHCTVFVLDNRILIQRTAASEDSRYGHRFRFVKEPMKPETEVFDIGWPRPVPPTGVGMDDISRFVVFDETDPLCDGRETIPLVRDIIDAVDSTATAFDRFFPV